MTRIRIFSVISVLVLLAGLVAVPAYADEWSKTTKITTNVPLEIPGRVLLPGSYVLKLASLESDRNVVQVWNADQTRLYATLIAIPDYSRNIPTQPLIMLKEGAANTPDAVQAWFYPGDRYGEEFVYPRRQAMRIARGSGATVLAMPDGQQLKARHCATSGRESRATNNACVFAVTPDQKEVPADQVVNPEPR